MLAIVTVACHSLQLVRSEVNILPSIWMWCITRDLQLLHHNQLSDLVFPRKTLTWYFNCSISRRTLCKSSHFVHNAGKEYGGKVGGACWLECWILRRMIWFILIMTTEPDLCRNRLQRCSTNRTMGYTIGHIIAVLTTAVYMNQDQNIGTYWI